MSKVASTLAEPIQGVSQKDRVMRNDGEATQMDNMFPVTGKGALNRPGSLHIASIADRPNKKEYIHHYKRTDEHYQVVLKHNSDKGTCALEVYDVETGVKQNVTSSASADAYIVSNDPINDIRMFTIGDTTFVLNRTKVPAALTTTNSYPQDEGLIYVKSGSFGTTVRLYIENTLIATHVNATGVAPDDLASSITAESVAAALFAITGASVTVGSRTFSVSLDSNLLHFKCTSDDLPFSLKANDGTAAEDVIAITRSVTNLSQLPSNPPTNTTESLGYFIKVDADRTQGQDDFFLQARKYKKNTVWVEVCDTDIPYQINAATMPMLLIRTSFTGSVANFTLDVATWGERDVGNDDTNPFPSFIGNPLKSIGLHQNRLFFTHSGDTVSMSRTDNFFNFFRTTSQISLDTDAIEIYSDSNQITELKSSFSLDGDTILFSDAVQLILLGEGVTSNATAQLKEQSSYQNIASVDPVSNGSSIFFAFQNGQYSGIKEYYTDNVSGSKRAVSLTEHVSEYIPGTVTKLAVSGSTNVLCVLSDEDVNEMYVYNWMDSQRERIQNAWHKWVYPVGTEIIDVYFQEGVMYIELRRNAGGTTQISKEKIVLNDPDDDGVGFGARLDRKGYVEAVYRSKGVWRMTKPSWNFDEGDLVYVRTSKTGTGVIACYDGEEGLDIGYDATETYHESDVDLADPAVGTKVYVLVGMKYNSVYTPSMPVVRDFRDRPVGIQHLIVTQFFINFIRTGHVQIDIINKYRITSTITFDGRIMGDPGNYIGSHLLASTTFNFPVRLRAETTEIQLSTNSHYPMQIRDFEWRGKYTPRGRRI